MLKNKNKLLFLSMVSFSMMSFSIERVLASNEAEIKVKTEYNISKDSVSGHSKLLADRLEISKRIAKEKKVKEAALRKEAESQESLEFPAIDLYGENSWNDRLNPVAGLGVDIPSAYDIDLNGFNMPVDKRMVTSGFGYRRRFGRMHFGTDLGLRTGDPVKSAFDGRVRVVDYEGKGYGHYIIVRHPNGLETLYGHLSRTIAKVGDIVRAGDVIGLGGSTGRSTGPHLHLEARFMGVCINPEVLFDFISGEPKMETYKFVNSSISRTGRSKTQFANTGEINYKSTTKKSSKDNVNSRIQTHKVKAGETLSSIARKYGTSVAKLQKFNGGSTRIRAGSSIRIS